MPKRCKECGAIVYEDMAWCPYDGAELEAIEGAQPASPPKTPASTPVGPAPAPAPEAAPAPPQKTKPPVAPVFPSQPPYQPPAARPGPSWGLIIGLALVLPIGGYFVIKQIVDSNTPAATVSIPENPPATSEPAFAEEEPQPNPVEEEPKTVIEPPKTPYWVASSDVDITASSTQRGYQPMNIFDGRRDTTWAEGAPGGGIGETIEFRFRDGIAREVITMMVLPGYDKLPQSENDEFNDRWALNDRLVRANISGDGFSVEATFDPFTRDFQRVPGLAGRKTTFLRLEILEVHQGNFKEEEDLCISEIKLEVRDAD